MSRQDRKVLVVAAHDDDMVIGVGGVLLLRHQNDRIHQIVCTNGGNSHKVVLGVTEDPTPQMIIEARKRELQESNEILRRAGLSRLSYEHWLHNDTSGDLTRLLPEVEQELSRHIAEWQPDVVYFHAPDGHQDHRAVNMAVEAALRKTAFKGEACTFSIWTKAVAENNPEIDVQDVPDLLPGAEIVDVRGVLGVKERALMAFKSQVHEHPYEEWPVQPRAILLPGFQDYYLRGEEVITPWL